LGRRWHLNWWLLRRRLLLLLLPDGLHLKRQEL
jgi:hypothetical protein